MNAVRIPFALLVGIALLMPGAVRGQSLADKAREIRQRHAAAAAQRSAEKRPSRRVAMLQALAFRELDVDFDATHARDAFEFIRTALGVNLVVREIDDASGFGIDPHTPITLKGEKMVAVDVLELVIEQCSVDLDCTWQLRGSFIEVGPKERLGQEAAQELRVYPIDELLFEAPRYENAPTVGFNYGYPGWIGGYDSDASTRGAYRFVGPYGYGPALRTGGGFGPAAVGTGAGAAYGDDASINSDAAKSERAEALIETIVTLVEPDAWTRNGGALATITYQDGTLVVRAPDFIQRQLGGYGPIPPPDDTPAPPTAP
jgi:hypothetical protein